MSFEASDCFAVGFAAFALAGDVIDRGGNRQLNHAIHMLAICKIRLDPQTALRLINELRWQLHELWPEWEIPKRVLVGPGWQAKVARRLQRAEPTVRVRIARDEIRRIRDLTRTINELHQ